MNVAQSLGVPPSETLPDSDPPDKSGFPVGRIFIVCAAVLALTGLAILVAALTKVSPKAPVYQAHIDPLGIYIGPGNEHGAKLLGQAIGGQPAYAMEFLDGTSWKTMDNAKPQLSHWERSGYSMIWGIPILPDGNAYSLASGATGAYDKYFVKVAKALVAGGQGRSIVRLGWEFNGGWFPWAANGQASNFVAYWRQIVDAMRSVAGANFKFEWNPTLGDLGDGNLAQYYPGDHYVDYVGVDVYDQSWAEYPGAAAEFATMKTEPFGLDWIATFAAAHGKQITLPEWGLGAGPGAGGAPISKFPIRRCRVATIRPLSATWVNG